MRGAAECGQVRASSLPVARVRSFVSFFGLGVEEESGYAGRVQRLPWKLEVSGQGGAVAIAKDGRLRLPPEGATCPRRSGSEMGAMISDPSSCACG